MRKERIVVIFPGRGSYGANELGYLAQYHGPRSELLARFDDIVARQGGVPARELDAASAFSPATHLPGRNASNLIYACALADFAAINRERYEIVAVCGNSLGWYLTLAAGGGLSLDNGARLVDTMGGLMERKGVGGQILYSLVDEDWRFSPMKAKAVENALAEANRQGAAFMSIRLGGVAVLAGDRPALSVLMKALPQDERYPMMLPKHAAFHTPLLSDIAIEAQELLPEALFSPPAMPMIDGRGAIWTREGTDRDALHAYTLGAQITETYDFSKSIEVALKEFAPDRLVLAGPGSSLGAPIAQILIALRWAGVDSRDSFQARQSEDPFLIALGRPEQRALGVAD